MKSATTKTLFLLTGAFSLLAAVLCCFSLVSPQLSASNLVGASAIRTQASPHEDSALVARI
ncbi:MAG: hypothetical protein WA853_16775, partial [Candidatus Acidiferrum sp.]